MENADNKHIVSDFLVESTGHIKCKVINISSLAFIMPGYAIIL